MQFFFSNWCIQSNLPRAELMAVVYIQDYMCAHAHAYVRTVVCKKCRGSEKGGNRTGRGGIRNRRNFRILKWKLKSNKLSNYKVKTNVLMICWTLQNLINYFHYKWSTFYGLVECKLINSRRLKFMRPGEQIWKRIKFYGKSSSGRIRSQADRLELVLSLIHI